MVVCEYSATFELFVALEPGWKLYARSCSLGLGDKQLLLFVAFFLMEKCLLFTDATYFGLYTPYKCQVS